MFKHRTLSCVVHRTNRYYSSMFDKIPSSIQDLLNRQIVQALKQISSRPDGLPTEKQNKPQYNLVALHPQKKETIRTKKMRECTLYVKGFLNASSSSSAQILSSFIDKYKSKKNDRTKQEEVIPERPTLKTAEQEIKEEPTADDETFQWWKRSHDILVHKPTHQWAEPCYAWNWPSGRLPQQFHSKDPDSFLSFVPVPIATLALAAGRIIYSLIRYRTRNPLLILASPAFLATGLMQDVALSVAVCLVEHI